MPLPLLLPCRLEFSLVCMQNADITPSDSAELRTRRTLLKERSGVGKGIGLQEVSLES